MKQSLQEQIIGSLAYWLSKLTNGSLRLEVINQQRMASLQSQNRAVILAFWHGQLWLPVYYWRDRGYVGLVSRSQDGEYISQVLQRLGWQLVRGSTSRGGTGSLLGLMRKLKAGKTVAITPDGPTGPYRQVKPGIIYLAQKTDSVILPVGVAFKSKQVFSSWDSFELPYPYSQARLVYGETLTVEKDSTVTIEESIAALEKRLSQAVSTAEKTLED